MANMNIGPVLSSRRLQSIARPWCSANPMILEQPERMDGEIN
jgi:hypothetical protein